MSTPGLSSIPQTGGGLELGPTINLITPFSGSPAGGTSPGELYRLSFSGSDDHDPLRVFTGIILGGQRSLSLGTQVIGPVPIPLLFALGTELAGRIGFLLTPGSALQVTQMTMQVFEGESLVFETNQTSFEFLFESQNPDKTHALVLDSVAREKAAPFLNHQNTVSFSMALDRPAAVAAGATSGSIAIFDRQISS